MLKRLEGMTSTDADCPVVGGCLALSEISAVVLLTDGDILITTRHHKDIPIPGTSLMDALPKEDFLDVPKTDFLNRTLLRKAHIYGYVMTDDFLKVFCGASSYGAPVSFSSQLDAILAENDKA